MKKLNIDISRYAPVGTEARRQVTMMLAALAISVLWSFKLPSVIIGELNYLKGCLEAGMNFPVDGFTQLIGSAFYGFYIIALVSVGWAVWNYAGHRRGTRADYLMRRLPDRWEYHRRCLTLPLAGIVLSLGSALLLRLSYRALYWSMFNEITRGLEDPERFLLSGIAVINHNTWGWLYR